MPIPEPDADIPEVRLPQGPTIEERIVAAEEKIKTLKDRIEAAEAIENLVMEIAKELLSEESLHNIQATKRRI